MYLKENILLTGASGFVGKRFCSQTDTGSSIQGVSLQKTRIDDIDFSQVSTVLHLAGIAHRMEKTDDSLYYDVNYKLTKELASRAKECGVKHFIFMSTIKVFGDRYKLLTPDLPCLPTDAYGKSKLMGEEAIRELKSDDFVVSIIRPPLVYGPGVKGNMKKLLELVDRRRILPLGGINNKRSMVAVDNLISLIFTMIEKRVSGTFLVQDEVPVSTSELLNTMAEIKEVKLKLVSIPIVIRNLIKALKPEIYKRVFGSLVVDDSFTRTRLGFNPSISTAEGIKIMIKDIENE